MNTADGRMSSCGKQSRLPQGMHMHRQPPPSGKRRVPNLLTERNVLDVWFLKPRLFKSTTGRWLCTSTCVDEWRATGNGLTLLEAYEDMKRVIAGRYKPRKTEFVYDY